jgi:hypothetical protein
LDFLELFLDDDARTDPSAVSDSYVQLLRMTALPGLRRRRGFFSFTQRVSFAMLHKGSYSHG